MRHLLSIPAYRAARSLAPIGTGEVPEGRGGSAGAPGTKPPRRPAARPHRYLLFRIVPAPARSERHGSGQYRWLPSHLVYARERSSGEVRRLWVIGPEVGGPDGGTDGPPDGDGPAPRPPGAATCRHPPGRSEVMLAAHVAA